MREIKFRGRIIEGLRNGGAWVYWGILGCDMIDATDRDTRGQYTGLKDKNDKEIYEGDVLQFEDHEGLKYIGNNKTLTHWPNIGKVYWDNGWEGNPNAEFNCTSNSGNNQPTWWMCASHKIIGNIYENPELLEN
jgi:uncharacterized phage protein (TIGR01671 family)